MIDHVGTLLQVEDADDNTFRDLMQQLGRRVGAWAVRPNDEEPNVRSAARPGLHGGHREAEKLFPVR
jgi:hypothetical protein